MNMREELERLPQEIGYDWNRLADAILARFSLTPVEDEEKTVKLDPAPWVCSHGERWKENAIVPVPWCINTFAPRAEYSQNESDYR